MCMVVCLDMSALGLSGDLPTVYPASHAVSAGMLTKSKFIEMNRVLKNLMYALDLRSAGTIQEYISVVSESR